MWAGYLASRQGDDSAATHALLSESVALWRRVGDARGLARAVGILGSVLHPHDRAKSRSLVEECRTLYRQIDDELGLTHVLVGDGHLAEREGDYERAHARPSKKAWSWRGKTAP